MYHVGQATSAGALGSPAMAAGTGAVAGAVAGFLWPSGKGARGVTRSTLIYGAVGAGIGFCLFLWNARYGPFQLDLTGEAS